MRSDDIADVIATVNLYALAVDTQQWDLFDRVFTEDVSADFGGPSQFTGLATFKTAFDMVHKPHKATQHITTNHMVVVNGDEANSMAYVHGRFIREVEGGNLFESTGWYDDKLIRTKAGWRIKHRTCRMIWWSGNIRVMETIPGVKIELTLDAMRDEAGRGKIAFLDAVRSAK